MRQTLQRLVFPQEIDPDVLPLYADIATWGDVSGIPIRLSSAHESELEHSRYSVRIPSGLRVSFGSYFNAFPASYWQRWTIIDAVELEVVVSGPATVIIYKSNAAGVGQGIQTIHSDGVEKVHRLPLPLESFGDGGWYWFDVLAGADDAEIHSASWSTSQPAVSPGELSIGITTYNKPDFCMSTLASIKSDPDLNKVLDRIFVIDQGTDCVNEQPKYSELQQFFGQSLQVIQQPNLGGSGGFARSMAELVQRDDSAYLLILDDDVMVETEGIFRAYQFARYCREPMLVGGHMFDLYNKTVIHAWAEIVRPDVFFWGPSFEEQHRHDFKTTNLRQTPWMHARLDSDYNGWWMCLIPKKVIKEIGYALPMFIKWDDAEYGLRAKNAGYRTVSLPGMALWHISWLDKDDTQDWQVYFHTRNRVIAGLLHANAKTGSKLLQNNSRQDIKKLLNMQYYATQLAVDALKSVLDGPSQLHDTIRMSMPVARMKARDFVETRVFNSGESVPPTHFGRVLPSVSNEEKKYPKGLRLALFAAKWVPIAWMRKTVPADQTPAIEFPKPEAHWWEVPKYTSVLVGTADGSGKMWYRHNRDQFRRLFRESRQLHRKIRRNWNSLAAQYRAAATQLVSDEAWQRTFDSDETDG